MTDYQAHYDKGADLLTVRKADSEIKQSIKIGDITVDFDAKGRVVGIESLNASDNLIFDDRVDEPVDALMQIEDADLDVKYHENGLTVIAKIVMTDTAQQSPIEGMMQTGSPAIPA